MLIHDFSTAIEAQEANPSMYLPMSFDDIFFNIKKLYLIAKWVKKFVFEN